ncbi:MAG: Grx4 family monothiol glutaredoxin [Deltaproteobacteria bacterium]|nr:Grx4 family monothiol glutaredoxin [Deltaproteobacteria bacterium]
MSLTPELHEELNNIITKNPVVLFMKGTRQLPRCGFSASVTSVLDELIDEYVTVDVLARSDVRDGIKAFSDWPTIPQLYVKGEFVGGADIVRELFQKGELQKLLGVEEKPVEPPALHVTERAAKELRGALEGAEPGEVIRFEVDRAYNFGLSVDRPGPADLVVEVAGLRFAMDKGSARRANGTTFDFADRSGGGSGFRITNPNEPAKVRSLSAPELKAKLDAKEPLWLLDVRGDDERAIAKIEGARRLDPATESELDSLDKKEAVLVFHCHHGRRSLAAAQHFLGKGFQKVYNLEGGIEAWSRDVDSSIARY